MLAPFWPSLGISPHHGAEIHEPKIPGPRFYGPKFPGPKITHSSFSLIPTPLLYKSPVHIFVDHSQRPELSLDICERDLIFLLATHNYPKIPYQVGVGVYNILKTATWSVTSFTKAFMGLTLIHGCNMYICFIIIMGRNSTVVVTNYNILHLSPPWCLTPPLRAEVPPLPPEWEFRTKCFCPNLKPPFKSLPSEFRPKWQI